MNTTSTLYETAHRPLLAVLDAVPSGMWTRQSPCADWSARDVVDHVIQTQREFLAGRGIDLGNPPDVAADPVVAWRDHADRVTEAIADDAVVERAYEGHFGRTTVGATLEQFYIWDMLVHRWDIARTAGIDAGLTNAELDRIDSGADSFGEALYMDGICRPGVAVPAEADRETRALARLGRTA
jgi:uncharacterized protein (TIGR03086 family)